MPPAVAYRNICYGMVSHAKMSNESTQSQTNSRQIARRLIHATRVSRIQCLHAKIALQTTINIASAFLAAFKATFLQLLYFRIIIQIIIAIIPLYVMIITLILMIIINSILTA